MQPLGVHSSYSVLVEWPIGVYSTRSSLSTDSGSVGARPGQEFKGCPGRLLSSLSPLVLNGPFPAQDLHSRPQPTRSLPCQGYHVLNANQSTETDMVAEHKLLYFLLLLLCIRGRAKSAPRLNSSAALSARSSKEEEGAGAVRRRGKKAADTATLSLQKKSSSATVCHQQTSGREEMLPCGNISSWR